MNQEKKICPFSRLPCSENCALYTERTEYSEEKNEEGVPKMVSVGCCSIYRLAQIEYESQVLTGTP